MSPFQLSFPARPGDVCLPSRKTGRAKHPTCLLELASRMKLLTSYSLSSLKVCLLSGHRRHLSFAFLSRSKPLRLAHSALSSSTIIASTGYSSAISASDRQLSTCFKEGRVDDRAPVVVAYLQSYWLSAL
ncbi:hypothetical protein E2C01_031348 [Portunus trituberculatus]|uniref:Uncharacterized protein n=1 Tax=Portunus trituberculatus TaxID=210409 RepID=A0A5B7EYB9_PORTR|nr:hypothetical protein [Portunus trituberculatus]